MDSKGLIIAIVSASLVSTLISSCIILGVPQIRETLRGPEGAIGVTGAQGPTGSQGVKGDTGLRGLQGLQGPQGIQGPTGAVGAQGAQGIQGLQGPSKIPFVSVTSRIADVVDATGTYRDIPDMEADIIVDRNSNLLVHVTLLLSGDYTSTATSGYDELSVRALVDGVAMRPTYISAYDVSLTPDPDGERQRFSCTFTYPVSADTYTIRLQAKVSVNSEVEIYDRELIAFALPSN
ncbi:MAG: hypothetical protein NTV15_01410 [Candidatus Bathyarchaeota archaeon]|nr:hypothetical protein [Candidatus Bathyarchaeota archaeon]